MAESQGGHRVARIPLSRRAVEDSLRVSHRQHTIYGLVEFDVTDARAAMRQHLAATGEKLSFTAFVIACLGRAVERNTYLHAYKDWRDQLVLFDDVDICCMFEMELEGRKFPLAHVIRASNRRSFREIHEEVRAVQAEPESSPSFHMGRGSNGSSCSRASCASSSTARPGEILT